MPRRQNMSYFIVLMIGAILTLAFMLLFYKGFSLLSFINSLFMTSLIMIIAGGIMLVLQGGFMNGFAYGMRRFFSSTSRSQEYASEIEKDFKKHNKESQHYVKRNPKFKLTTPLLVTGLLFFVISIVVSFVV